MVSELVPEGDFVPEGELPVVADTGSVLRHTPVVAGIVEAVI